MPELPPLAARQRVEQFISDFGARLYALRALHGNAWTSKVDGDAGRGDLPFVDRQVRKGGKSAKMLEPGVGDAGMVAHHFLERLHLHECFQAVVAHS